MRTRSAANSAASGAFAPPPGDRPPLRAGEQVLGRDRRLARHRPQARPAGAGLRPEQRDLGAVGLLHLRDAHGPAEAPGGQGLAEQRAVAVAGVGQHAAEAEAEAEQPVDLGQRHLALGPRRAARLRHAGPLQPRRVDHPLAGQEELQRDGHRHLVPGQRQRHERLAVGVLAERPGVLARHAHRGRALLRQRRVVHHQHGVGPAEQRVRLGGEHGFERRAVPGRAGDEVVQLVVRRQAEADRHRLHALALAGQK
jgi:hypothetical protein